MADLVARYGARLMPPEGQGERSVIWVKGDADATLAFDLGQEQHVTGFRVGTESFVTASEYCG